MNLHPPSRTPNNAGPKVCRISWNGNSWQSPSGARCKSPNQGNHEHDFGYGYEEWLFDPAKRWDGYQYGFLQPINKHFNLYSNQLFPDIYLYTINFCTNKRYWVAHLRDVEILTQEECATMSQVYEEQGWIPQMLHQINQDEFTPYHNGRLAHLRFKPVTPYNNGQLIPIRRDHPVYGLNRFILCNAKGMELPD